MRPVDSGGGSIAVTPEDLSAAGAQVQHVGGEVTTTRGRLSGESGAGAGIRQAACEAAFDAMVSAWNTALDVLGTDTTNLGRDLAAAATAYTVTDQNAMPSLPTGA